LNKTKGGEVLKKMNEKVKFLIQKVLSKMRCEVS
jgi:hypothetical protein